MPRLYINRRLAMEHRDNPALDPSCKNAVFTQVFLLLERTPRRVEHPETKMNQGEVGGGKSLGARVTWWLQGFFT